MDWQQNKIIETKYHTALQIVCKVILDSIKNATTVSEINLKLQYISDSTIFQSLADTTALKFITNANILDEKTWRSAARANSKSRLIYEQLQKDLTYSNVGKVVSNQIFENSRLIRSLPSDLSRQVSKFIATNAYSGLRASEIASVLQQKVWQYSRARASVIARTEASKAMTALTEARSRDVGVKWYIWKTANDGNRVRKSHQHMQGVLVNFDEPPSPEQLVHEKNVGYYNAGNIYNCRCFPRPLITLDNVTFPCKVYHNGTIKTMSKAQFQKIMG